MNLTILLNAPLAIQLHVYAALLAFVIGMAVLWGRKGSQSHKHWGKIWVALMTITALTSFFIHEIRLIGAFSPIHLISIGTLVSLYFGVKRARTGNIARHQRAMKAIFVGAIGIAGTLAFMPGRMMFDVALAPLVEKLFASTNFNPPTALLDSDWPVLVVTISVILSVIIWKPVRQFFESAKH